LSTLSKQWHKATLIFGVLSHKDEGLRLRRCQGKGDISSLSSADFSSSAVDVATQQLSQLSQSTIVAVVIFVVLALLLGLIVGKFVL